MIGTQKVHKNDKAKFGEWIMDAVKKYISAIGLGLAVGIVTLIGQKYLPMNLNFLANSGAIWLVPAFLLSYFWKKDIVHSIAVTIICLLGCVYGYYIFEAVLNRHGFTLAGGALLWSVVALLAGAVFGLGAFFANQKHSKLKYLGANLLPAVFTAEGLDNVIHIEDYSHMIPAVISDYENHYWCYFVPGSQQKRCSRVKKYRFIRSCYCTWSIRICSFSWKPINQVHLTDMKNKIPVYRGVCFH